MYTKTLSILVLYAFTTVCQSFEYDSGFDLFSLRDTYEKINQHLSKNVKGDDFAENIQEAKRWLDEEVSQTSDHRLKTALELFTSMETLSTCDKQSYDIVEANDYLTGQKARLISNDSSSKVLKIIAHYGTKHAQKCIEKYGETIHRAYNKIGELNTERVHRVADKLIWQPQENEGKILFDVIKQLSQGSHHEKYLESVPTVRGKVDHSNLGELFNTHLVDPCLQYLELNKNGLIYAIQYYAQWVNPTDELISKLPYRYRICDRLVITDFEASFNAFKNEVMSHE